MENQIRLLKNGTFKDSVKNPLLINFNPNHLAKELDKAEEKSNQERIDLLERKTAQVIEIQKIENFLISSEGDSSNRAKQILMESGISSSYYSPESVFSELERRIDNIHNSSDWEKSDVIDKVYLYFIRLLENQISDASFLRLQHPKARDFYKLFTKQLHRLNLKDHISEVVKYFHSIKFEDIGKEFYIGASYGEIAKNTSDGARGNNVYIDLSRKTDKELVNLALVKIKIESDFVSYRLNEYVSVLYDLKIISEDEYNMHIYGTTKKSNTEFVKIGLSGSLINKLERDKQIENISITKSGEVKYNSDFSNYVKSQDDLLQFEIKKYIEIT